ncbi:hypothetical protein J7E50_14340 [Pedobacter sp. ISL-68]|uniref:hypothetical protein n=1 Tax=Pedobacter sp. ISL-68 TaxID=2819165 RepID=UPI001BE8074A|nr:hypothetical protein [Pedobacter sp. ISL-68]MBT2591405.1 hypothetical protein [Pedobacter sp. ISL-68]
MNFLFKRKRNENTQATGNSIAKGEASLYRLQSRWAKWMEKRTESFSRGHWTLILILFVLITGGHSTYLLVSSFSSKERKVFLITPISKPRHLTETGDVKAEALSVTETEYRRIHNFRIYMDSLARTPSGKASYDSITYRRPGLMDSVRNIENYYQQLKNE